MEKVVEILNQTRLASLQDLKCQTVMTSANYKTNPLLVMSNDEAVAGIAHPEPVICEYCGSKRYTQGFVTSDRIIWNFGGADPCTCRKAVEAREKLEKDRQAQIQASHQAEEAQKTKELVRRKIGESGMGERFLKRTFETFQITIDNEVGARITKQFADNFINLSKNWHNNERNGLFIVGSSGTGKTHLAAAIANQLMRAGISVVFMTSINLFERIKKTFDHEDSSEWSVLHIYKTVPLLVIDDLGKEQCTEWSVSILYNIINSRYESYLPVIITCNYGDQVLVSRLTPRTNRDSITAESIVDRLREMCTGVILSGPSWRAR